MATTRLGMIGVPWRPYGTFVAKTAAASGADPVGLEYTPPGQRLHYTPPDNRLHYTPPGNRLHYTPLPEG